MRSSIDEGITFKCLQIMCAKYYELRHLVIVGAFFDKLIASKLALVSGSDLKDEKLIKSTPT